MPITAEYISTDAEGWTALLASADHDFYHLPCYQKLTVRGDEVARAFLASDGTHRLLLPFHLRRIPSEIAGEETLFDIGSPYGYPGPIWSRGAPDSFVHDALALFAAGLKEQRIVTGFFRLHTLLNRPEHFAGTGELVQHGVSVYIDLTLSEEELWQQTRRGHRRDLAVLEKRGYEIEVDESWAGLDEFLVCYYESMRRLNAAPFYFFSKEYFQGLRECLGDRIHLCLVRLDGDIACAGIVTEMEGLCQYHLSATADAHLPDHPSKLMLHWLRSWLKTRGNRVYHVGGGVGSLRDTLHLFKSGFSPNAADFYTWRIVGDTEQYDRLVAQWSASSGKDPADLDGYFPPYRAPVER